LEPQERRFDVERVLLRLEQEKVGAALDESPRRLGVGDAHLVETDAAGDRDRLRARPERSGDKSRFLARRGALGGLSRDAGGGAVDLERLVLQAVFGQDVA